MPGSSVTILIPTHRRPVELERCLQAVRQQGAAEVVTIHTPGDDESIAVAAAAGARPLAAPQRNLSLQRNLGARAAAGDILVYLDDDAWPAEGWLPAILAPFADPAIAAVGGKVVRGDGTVQYGAMAVTSLARPFALGDAGGPPAGTARTLPGGNLAIRRQVLLELGGFDENLVYHFDDVDLSLRLWAAGRHTGYAADAVVYHEPAPGPHRRTVYDRDWYTVTKNSIYLALRHGGRGTVGTWIGALGLQLPKTLRFCAWLVRGRFGPSGFVRAVGGQLRGVLAGFAKGLWARPRLPLAAAPLAPPAPPGSAATGGGR